MAKLSYKYSGYTTEQVWQSTWLAQDNMSSLSSNSADVPTSWCKSIKKELIDALAPIRTANLLIAIGSTIVRRISRYATKAYIGFSLWRWSYISLMTCWDVRERETSINTITAYDTRNWDEIRKKRRWCSRLDSTTFGKSKAQYSIDSLVSQLNARSSRLPVWSHHFDLSNI